MCMWVTSDEYIFGSKVGFLKDVGWGCVTNKGIELQIKGYSYSKSGETEVSLYSRTTHASARRRDWTVR